MGRASEAGRLKPLAELMTAELDVLPPGQWKHEVLHPHTLPLPRVYLSRTPGSRVLVRHTSLSNIYLNPANSCSVPYIDTPGHGKEGSRHDNRQKF